MINELGYYFHPLPQAGTHAYSQLDINIYSQPTEKHFDPIRVHLFIFKADQDLVRVTIGPSWTGTSPLRVGPGRVILQDYRDKMVTAFTFGGKMEITNHSLYTSCELTSPAPIFHLVPGQDPPTILVTEFESFLARRRAEWAGNEAGFEGRLAKIEPFTLFVVGLATIKEHMQHVPPQLRGQLYRQEAHVINEAIRTVQENGHWPVSLPTLAALL
ncbi:MAG: hypothetical protein KJ077_14600 [Anaerolineae bacterium]|nr:hypothetical protein [Anaerolineae bacterium]